MWTPMLGTSRLLLRPVERDDLVWLTGMLTDGAVGWQLSRPYPQSLEQTQRWWEDLQQRQGVTEFHFAIWSREGETPLDFIGVCNLFDVDWPNRKAGVAIATVRDPRRGRGFGGETIDLLCRYAFDELALHRVWATVWSTNKPSLTMFNHCGFDQEGVDRESVWLHGAWVDTVRLARIEGA
jgi:RimJ/RimL family protein N-acetyltransferase